MELDKQPKPDIRDYAHAIVKGTISSIPIPFVPGIAAEIFSILFTPSLLKRQDEWMSSIAQGLIQLQEKVEGFNLEDLSSNESFVTVTLQATQHALRNHQMEKLEALRNAVLNSALPNTLEDDIQLIFLGLVDTLTTWHLRILKPVSYTHLDVYKRQAHIRLLPAHAESPAGSIPDPGQRARRLAGTTGAEGGA